MTAWWRRHPRIAFFVLGAAVTVLCGASQVFWYDVANNVLHLNTTYDTRPTWLRGVMFVLAWLPVFTFALVMLGFLRRGRVYRPLAFIAGAVSVYVVAVASLFGGPVVDEYRHAATFEAAAWQKNAQSDVMWPTRLTMVDDLLARRLLERATRDSVARLLGPRDSTNYFSTWELVYHLGPERGLMRIDSEWLVVAFGPDGRVSAARIVRD